MGFPFHGKFTGKPRMARKTKTRTQEIPAELFARWLVLQGLPAPVLEYKFHPRRKWRTDLAWPDLKLACEIEGGVFSRGRHVRPVGFLRDVEKYNAYAVMGWSLLRVVPSQVQDSDPFPQENPSLREIYGTKKKKRFQLPPATEVILAWFNERGLA